jgi:AcrR family transcriptional regulator
MFTGFKRARQPEQKELRRSSILSAARELLEEEGVDRVALTAIAHRADLAKSNIYRYFESREHIFLTLLSSEWAAWSKEVERELGRRGADVDEAARVFTHGFVARPRLCELMSRLAPVLERNVSEETVLELRTRTTAAVFRVANALHGTLPKISVNGCVWAVRMMSSTVAGLWPVATPTGVVARVDERPQFQDVRPDFRNDLEAAVRALLYGLLVEVARLSHR